jgi:hypothetical protein
LDETLSLEEYPDATPAMETRLIDRGQRWPVDYLMEKYEETASMDIDFAVPP